MSAQIMNRSVRTQSKSNVRSPFYNDVASHVKPNGRRKRTGPKPLTHQTPSSYLPTTQPLTRLSFPPRQISYPLTYRPHHSYRPSPTARLPTHQTEQALEFRPTSTRPRGGRNDAAANRFCRELLRRWCCRRAHDLPFPISA